jgi:hypothetical protein
MITVPEMLEITVDKILKLFKFHVLVFDLVEFGRVQVDRIAMSYNCRSSHRMLQLYLVPGGMSPGDLIGRSPCGGEEEEKDYTGVLKILSCAHLLKEFKISGTTAVYLTVKGILQEIYFDKEYFKNNEMYSEAKL